MATRGRKPKYSRELLPQIEQWLNEGAINKDICEKLNINQDTFYQWLKRYPELVEVIARAKAVANDKVVNALYKRALGYEYEEVTTEIQQVGDKQVKQVKKVKKHVPSDTHACSIWLYNRDRENWKSRYEITGKDGGPVQVQNNNIDLSALTDEELEVISKIAERPNAGSDTKGKG